MCASPSTPSSPTLDRRSILQLGAAGAAVAALTACSDDSDEPGGNGGGAATVRVWSWYGEQEDEFPRLAEEFMDDHPNIDVQIRVFGTPDQYLPALQAAVAGDDVPEIFAPHTRTLEYGQAGISADLRSELDSSFFDDFFDSTNDQSILDGAQYAVGWMAQMFGLFYDPELLEQAGISEEFETWDDLIAGVDALHNLDVAPIAFAANPGTSALDFFLPLLTQVTDDPTFYLSLDRLDDGFSYDSEPVIEALRLNERIVQAGAFQDGSTSTAGAQAEQLFYTGLSAAYFSGSWTPQGLVQNAPPEFVDRYQVMRTPAIAPGARHWSANQAGANWSVSETSPNKEAALEFLQFLYSPDQYSPTMNNSNSMPSTRSAAERIENPVMQQMTSWLVDGDGCPHIPFGPGSSTAGDPLMQIFDGTSTPEAVAEEMQAAVLNARGA